MTVSARSVKPYSFARIMSWRNCSSGGSFLSQYGRLDQLRERGHALGRHGVVLHIRIDVGRREHHLVGEALERIVHALGRLAGHGQETHAGAVGLVLLGALIGEQRMLQDRTAAR